MANHKSAKKRIKQTETRTKVNNIRRSKVKTAVKKFQIAVEAKDKETANTAFRNAEKEMRRAAAKKVYDKGTISRRVSRLAKALKRAFSA